MIRLAANLGFLWPDRPLLERIAAAGRAGFAAVELHWPYDVPGNAVRAACAGAGVKLLGINTAIDAAMGAFGLAALSSREAEFAAAFAQSLAYCAESGASAIHVMAGIVADTPESEATLVANLSRVAPLAAKAGITILLEPLNPRDRPGYFYSRAERGAEIVAAVGADNVRLMFDCYHVGVGQGDVIRRLEALMPVIGHIQIAAVPSRAEPDEGELNFRAILAAIDGLGYGGWIGAEYVPRGDTDAGLGWRDRVLP